MVTLYRQDGDCTSPFLICFTLPHYLHRSNLLFMCAHAALAPSSANSSRRRQECRRPFPPAPLSETYAPWEIPIPGFPRVLSSVSFAIFRPKITGEKWVKNIAYALGIGNRSKVQIFAYAILGLRMLVESGNGQIFAYAPLYLRMLVKSGNVLIFAYAIFSANVRSE